MRKIYKHKYQEQQVSKGCLLADLESDHDNVEIAII